MQTDHAKEILFAHADANCTPKSHQKIFPDYCSVVMGEYLRLNLQNAAGSWSRLGESRCQSLSGLIVSLCVVMLWLFSSASNPNRIYSSSPGHHTLAQFTSAPRRTSSLRTAQRRWQMPRTCMSLCTRRWPRWCWRWSGAMRSAR